MSKSTPAQADDLRRLTQRLFRRFGALATDATPCGKPLSMAHAHALMILLDGGERSQQAMGNELCIDKSNVARLCAKMAAAGHVVQRSGEDDGRSRLVSLTEKGRRLAREVKASSGNRFELLLNALPVGSRQDVLDSLRELITAVEGLPPVRPMKRKPR